MIEQLLGWFDTLKNYIHYDASVSPMLRRKRIDKISKLGDWIKSFRLQKQWKPSKEQMEALKSAIMDIDKFSKRGGRQVEFENESYYNTLHLLYEQLRTF